MNSPPLAAQTQLLAFNLTKALCAGVNAAFLKPQFQQAQILRRLIYVQLLLDVSPALAVFDHE